MHINQEYLREKVNLVELVALVVFVALSLTDARCEAANRITDQTADQTTDHGRPQLQK